MQHQVRSKQVHTKMTNACKRSVGYTVMCFSGSDEEGKPMDKQVNKTESYSRSTRWVLALLLTAFVAGCGSGGGGESAVTDAGASTGASTAVSPVNPGAGTGTGIGLGPAPVVLGMAGNYAILAETKITTTGATAVTGDLGMSPAAATFVQGFSLVLDSGGCFSKTSPASLVTGKVYAADYNTQGCPTPANLTTAISNMMTAYTDAAGRAPDYTELGAGNIGGMTLPPAVYKWSSGLLIPTDVTLSGGPNDVWIFEIAQNLTVANGKKVILAGGALPQNIFWQVGGGTGVALGTTSHFEGIILAAKAITLQTGASANGRLLSRTAVTLQANPVTQP
jgi:hypothetical protein